VQTSKEIGYDVLNMFSGVFCAPLKRSSILMKMTFLRVWSVCKHQKQNRLRRAKHVFRSLTEPRKALFSRAQNRFFENDFCLQLCVLCKFYVGGDSQESMLEG